MTRRHGRFSGYQAAGQTLRVILRARQLPGGDRRLVANGRTLLPTDQGAGETNGR